MQLTLKNPSQIFRPSDVPPAPVPSVDELRQQVHVPELPREVPAVRVLLESFAREPVDPWHVDLDA